MWNVIAIPPVQGSLPIELQHLRVAAYCWVSAELEEQISSIELQERYYSHLISENPNWENAGFFSERVTGLNLKERTEFHRMISQCRKKKVDIFLTKSVGRFGRNTLNMLQSLQELRSLGVDVYFEQENMRLSGQQIQVLLAAYCAFAQAESEEMSQNIKWGIKRGFENGTSGYAEFVCFGYKRGNNGRLAIDKPNAIVVRQIFVMRANGASLGSIADWLFEKQILFPQWKIPLES